MPKVSIHIPAYREPPEMLKQTLDAVARLDYPNFECVVVINNTPDPAFWRPIEEHCRALGERFKFINARQRRGLQGRRAAARAGAHRGRRRDHRHHRRRLRGGAGLAEGPGAGVRRPAGRPGAGAAGSSRRRPQSDAYAMNGEYAGFFDIGMVQRNEAQRHHRARHDVPDPPRGADGRRRLVERHDLRGHRSRPDHPRARLARRITPTGATATACCPTPTRPTRSSATAGPMAASRSSRSTGAVSCRARAG